MDLKSRGFENAGRWLNILVKTERTHGRRDHLAVFTLILLVTFLLGCLARADIAPSTKAPNVRCIYDFRDHNNNYTHVFSMVGDLLEDTNDVWLIDFSKDTKIMEFQHVTGARVHRVHSNKCRLL